MDERRIDPRDARNWPRVLLVALKTVSVAKGETSGQVQSLQELRVDCDGDTLLLQVDQTGVACHTGRRSCFFRAVRNDEVVLLRSNSLIRRTYIPSSRWLALAAILMVESGSPAFADIRLLLPPVRQVRSPRSSPNSAIKPETSPCLSSRQVVHWQDKLRTALRQIYFCGSPAMDELARFTKSPTRR